MDLFKILEMAVWPVVLAIFFWPLRAKMGGDWSGFHKAWANRSFVAEVPGAKFSAIAAVEAQKEKLPEDDALLRNDLPAGQAWLPPTDREVVNLYEQELRSLVERNPGEDVVPNLVRALALVRVQGSHEWVYNRIFGSQIQFVKKANLGAAISVEEAREFYRPYLEAAPALKDYGFDGWLRFMLDNNLITQADDKLSIKAYGRDFLRFLVDAQLSELKAF